jgi:hypothetical protein
MKDLFVTHTTATLVRVLTFAPDRLLCEVGRERMGLSHCESDDEVAQFGRESEEPGVFLRRSLACFLHGRFSCDLAFAEL